MRIFFRIMVAFLVSGARPQGGAGAARPAGAPGEGEGAGLDFDSVDGPGHVRGGHRSAD